MKPITTVEELRSIQLEIMQSIHDFCDNNSIRYFLCGGTLIGAIRHDGYIPWDDDIDIFMPRPDYDKFMDLYNRSNTKYKFVDFKIDSTYRLPFGKVYDTRTVMDEMMYKKDVFGVYVDVFPLDGVIDAKQVERVSQYKKYLNAKKAIIGTKRSFKKNLIILLGKFLLLPYSVRNILVKIDNICRQIPYEGSEKVVFYYGYGPREIVKRSDFAVQIKHKFEDREFYIPVGYDDYLRATYGDYMQLPPEEQRVTHHTYKAWWK